MGVGAHHHASVVWLDGVPLGSCGSSTISKLAGIGRGVMLVGLGGDVLRKIIMGRIHVHVHQHPQQSPHVHIHSHRGQSHHGTLDHQHAHSTAYPYRALFVGLKHGMAGSAALILLTLQQTITPLEGIIYIATFGLGSIVGMATLSIVIAIPLRIHHDPLAGFTMACRVQSVPSRLPLA